MKVAVGDIRIVLEARHREQVVAVAGLPDVHQIGEPLPVRGHVTLLEKPGFGVELNRDLIQPVEF